MLVDSHYTYVEIWRVADRDISRARVEKRGCEKSLIRIFSLDNQGEWDLQKSERVSNEKDESDCIKPVLKVNTL